MSKTADLNWSSYVHSRKSVPIHHGILSFQSGEGGESGDGGPVLTHLPAAMTVPEIWPQVPVIAIARHPVFPRFIKIIEVSHLLLVDVLVVEVILHLLCIL